MKKSKRLYDLGIGIADENNLHGIRNYYDANIGLGRLYYEWNNLEKAREHFSEGFDLHLLSDSAESIFYLWQSVFPMLVKERKWVILENILSHFSQTSIKYKYSPIISNRIKTMEAHLAFAQSQTRTTEKWLVSFLATHSEISSFYRYEWCLAALIFIKQKMYPRAIQILHRLVDLANAGGHHFDKNQLHMKLVTAYYLSGDHELALKELDEILGEIAVEGYIRTVLDEGAIGYKILHDYLAVQGFSEKRKGYAQKLLAESDSFEGTEVFYHHVVQENRLTSREIEVINLLSQGLTYDHIAENLTISINTVRTYTKRIYQKLQVHNRTAAVLKWKAEYFHRDELIS
ncbi:LuxR C-terminal-related transcriptional regulator [bacterium]|nr:LuxR C-terminal-related transcriptional regulator [bacterium]